MLPLFFFLFVVFSFLDVMRKAMAFPPLLSFPFIVLCRNRHLLPLPPFLACVPRWDDVRMPVVLSPPLPSRGRRVSCLVACPPPLLRSMA
ncbi:hypothetical protein DFJ73DRAFT_878147 [Zopfochytrium polystomum]|nr:hypothetical protein DFJ73DRAFT_878147 [Zopfochytrium polystomum]